MRKEETDDDIGKEGIQIVRDALWNYIIDRY